jgi:hypothetical protein
MAKKLSTDAIILQNRTAFALFLKNGLDEVKRLYPDSMSFVQKNKGKTLREVTMLLSEKLSTQSEKLIPA